MISAMAPLYGVLGVIREEAALCRACPLGATAKNTVVYRGDTNPLVLFVGQSPGETEDELGVPFVGRSGELLDEKILESSFPRYGITNVVLHHPPKNDYLYDYAIACRPFLRRIVEAVNPTAIVTVGKDAALAMAGMRPMTPRFHIHHPSYILRGGSRAEWNDQWIVLRHRLHELLGDAYDG